ALAGPGDRADRHQGLSRARSPMSFRPTTAIDYVEDVSPGSGALPPRAWYASSDAASLSLNGSWRFRVSATADAEDDSFAEPGYDAGTWAEVSVPGHWVL